MKIRIIALMVVMLISSVAFGAEKSVPRVLAYQSMLYDEGGNPIVDGEAGVIFRITDSDGTVLFEEHQNHEVIRGGISALIGNGLTADGAPTGGVPSDVLNSNDARFLEVDVAGYPVTDPMEIASVPYSVYADQAYSVVKEGIDADAIKDGSIAFEDLSDDLVDSLSSTMSTEMGFISTDDLQTPSTASTIGVQRAFSYSGSNDLQGVLGDLDRAIKGREEKIARLNTDFIVHSQAEAGVHGIDPQEEVVGTDKTQTLKNKTLESPTVINGINIGGGAVISTGNLRVDENIEVNGDAVVSGSLRVDENVDVNGDAAVSGSVQVGENLEVGKLVDGVDISSHNHSGPGQGGDLYPSAIWINSGVTQTDHIVNVGSGFDRTNCRVMTALASADDPAGGILSISVGYEWNETGTAFTTSCNVVGSNGCEVSYFIMCIKGM